MKFDTRNLTYIDQMLISRSFINQQRCRTRTLHLDFYKFLLTEKYAASIMRQRQFFLSSKLKLSLILRDFQNSEKIIFFSSVSPLLRCVVTRHKDCISSSCNNGFSYIVQQRYRENNYFCN